MMIINIEDRNTATSIFLDLSKAFDYLNHDRLLEIRNSLGIRSILLKLLKGYLDNQNFEEFVLGPVVFVFFTTDLPVI